MNTLVVARKRLAESIPPEEPEKPTPEEISADVARLDNGVFQTVDLPEELLNDAAVSQVVATEDDTLFLVDDGRVFRWPVSSQPELLENDLLVKVTQIASTGSLVYFLRADGSLVVRTSDGTISLVSDVENVIEVVAGPGGALCTFRGGNMRFLATGRASVEITLGPESFTAAEVVRVDMETSPVFHLGNGSIFTYVG